MATLAQFDDFAEPVHRQLRARHVDEPASTFHFVCAECSRPVERSRRATSYGFALLCRQCEIEC